jgi:alkylresorcinol/alkylpyrone synthase
MGWDLTEEGLKVVFSQDIPTIVTGRLGPVIHDFLARQGLTSDDISHYITHPGGAKVIDAYQEALHLPPASMRHPRAVLRRFGNMSSASVLFVLREELEHAGDARPGDYGLLSALGPGFSAELLLIRWEDGAAVDRG